jgi:hypothetical protein
MQEGMDMKTYRWIALTALASAVMAQTRVDLRTQGKSVDFSAATATKPAKTGTVFPSTCSVGEMYFKTDAGAGANLYACTATNIWSLEGGSGTSSLPAMTGNTNRVLSNNGSAADWRLVGGDITGSPDNLSVIGLRGRIVSAAAPTGGQALVWNSSTVQWEPQNQSGSGGSGGVIMASQFGDLAASRVSNNVLSVGANCSAATPCNVRLGEATAQFTTSATITATTGDGIIRVFIDGSVSPPILRVRGSGIAPSCVGMNCAVDAGVAFPTDSIPLFTWTASGGSWDALGGVDYRAFLSTLRVVGGPGMSVVSLNGTVTAGVDATSVPNYLTALATINFPSIANGLCATEQTITLPGAAAGDSVAPGWPGGLESGLIGNMRVSSANTVSVRLCNLSGSVVDPASALFRATIVRSF